MKLRPCACIDTLYMELPFLERIAAAGRDGFAAVEFWHWQDRDMAAVRHAAQAAGIRVAGFNGDGPFSLIDPGQREAYLAYLARSMDAAKAAGAASLTIHSNALGEGGVVTDRGEGLSDTVRLCAMYEGLKACAAMAEDRGITLHLEALNPITDPPGQLPGDYGHGGGADGLGGLSPAEDFVRHLPHAAERGQSHGQYPRLA